MRKLFNYVSSIWEDVSKDCSFLMLLMGMIMVLVVGVIDEGYRSKSNKIRIDYNSNRKENLFQKSLIESQRNTIDKQKELIDELLKQLREEKKGKIYAQF